MGVAAFAPVRVGDGSGGEEGLDVLDDAGEQAQEPQVFAEFAPGGLFGIVGSVEREGEGEGEFGFVEVGDVVDESVLGSGVDEAKCR